MCRKERLGSKTQILQDPLEVTTEVPGFAAIHRMNMKTMIMTTAQIDVNEG